MVLLSYPCFKHKFQCNLKYGVSIINVHTIIILKSCSESFNGKYIIDCYNLEYRYYNCHLDSNKMDLSLNSIQNTTLRLSHNIKH